jgi:hypothetical protein
LIAELFQFVVVSLIGFLVRLVTAPYGGYGLPAGLKRSAIRCS